MSHMTVETEAERAQTTSSNDDLSRLVRGSAIALAGKITGRLLQIVVQVVIARLLGAAAFGLYGLGYTILRAGALVAPLGLDHGVIRYGASAWRRNPAMLRSVLLQTIGIALLTGLLVGAALFLSAPFLASTLFAKPEMTPVIRWFTPGFALASGLRVAASATRIVQRVQYAVLAEDLLQPAAHLALLGIVYWLGGRLIGFVASGVLSFAVSAVMAGVYVLRLFPEAFKSGLTMRPMIRELLSFSVPASLAGVFVMYVMWAGRLIVGFYRPVEEVGIYHAVSQSSIIFAVVLAGFLSIFVPMSADLHHRNETSRLEALFKVSTKWALYLCMPLFITICFAPRELIHVLFGQEYTAGATALLVLTTGQIVNAATGPVGPLLVITGHARLWLVISSAAFLITVGLQMILVPRLGIIGAAVGEATGVGLLFFLGLVATSWRLRVWPYDRRYLKGIVAAGVTVTLLAIMGGVGGESPLVKLLLTATVAGTGFFAVLLLIGLDPEDHQLVETIRHRVGPRGS